MRKMSIVSNGLEWEGVVVRKEFDDEEGMGVIGVGSRESQESRMGSRLHAKLHLQLVV
jgi:hypothetical protein